MDTPARTRKLEKQREARVTENALVPANLYEEYGTGLEDLDPNEVQVPRIKVDHPNAVFKDGITGDEFPALDGVLLGMVMQRTMWRRDYNGENDARPQCKSNDAAIGFPNMDSSNQDDHFPWNEAVGINAATLEKDEHGRLTIPCAACPFSKWTGTRQKPKPPRCSEIHSYPVMYRSEDGGEIDRAGIVSFKGSGIRPSKQFLKSFAAAKRAVYTSEVRVTLRPEQNGMIRYAVPEFSRTGSVPESEWKAYAEELKGLREILREPPRFSGDENNVAAGAAVTIPTPAPAAAYTPPTPRTSPEVAPTSGGSLINQAAAPVAPVVEEEELPF